MSVGVIVAGLLLGSVGLAASVGPSAHAQLAPAQPVAHPPVRDLCAPETPELAELSGLAADGLRWYAVSDGGSSLRVWVLDPADCAELDVITADVNPYDVEDLALGPDGALWLADIGDNVLRRETVALHRLDAEGTASLYRLTYPDGPHDAEALLLDRAGVPHVVTKELGSARVYRPTGPLAEPGPTPLEQVATLQTGPTDTPGGPLGGVGSVLVTGGDVSADGQVVGLRTYTDAYLYPVPDGDIVAALSREPLRIPLPDEPQGEAVTFTPKGTMLSGSESPPEYDGVPPIRAVSGAAGLLSASESSGTSPEADTNGVGDTDGDRDDPGASHQPPGDTTSAPLGPWQAGLVAAALAGLAALLTTGRRRRRG